MKISDLQLGTRTLLELAREDGAPFTGGAFLREEVTLTRPADQDTCLLTVGRQAIAVTGVSPAHRRALESVVDRDRPSLAWVVNAVPRNAPERLLVQVHEFTSHSLMDVEIRVESECLDELRRRMGQRGAPAAQVLDWLADELFLPRPRDPQTVRALISASPGSANAEGAAFRIHGPALIADVRRSAGGGLALQRVHKPSGAGRPRDGRPLHLAQGKLRFVEHEAQVRGLARTELDRIVAEADSYLTLWRSYNRVERRRLLRRARSLGWLRYSRWLWLESGELAFELEAGKPDAREPLLESEEEALELEAADTLPSALTAQSASSDEDPVDPDGEEAEDEERPSAARPRTPSFTGRLSRVAGRRVVVWPLEEDREPPPEGFLFRSLAGDLVRLRRREEAVARIRGTEGGILWLGHILEGQPYPVTPRRRIEPLTPTVRKVFKREPTEKQRHALELALRTPDVVLIQGPPGTGKTQVLAALSARLGELGEGEHSVAGQTLITSYQHDAVENAALKTRVFGLPPVKVGRRRQGGGQEVDGVGPFRRELAEQLQADLHALPERPASARLQRVRALAIAYQRAADVPGTVRLLEEVMELAGADLPPALRDGLLERKQALTRGPARATATGELRERALRAARALRAEEVPFSDDGPQKARLALTRFAEAGLSLSGDDEALLRRAGDWPPGPPPPAQLLYELSALKDRLVDQLLPEERPAAAPVADPEVEALLAKVIDALYRRIRSSREGVVAVLADLQHALENDPEGVREAIGEYTLVLAATCQQSDSREMRELKEDGFENVIVDEAARSNPLDLFIPLAKARRRIILVGDQRQLPHLLEPEVEVELGESVTEATRRALRESLFQRLFEQLDREAARGGPVRTITLDTQFRMHEALGAFVSKTFYERHGQVAIKAGRPAGDFVHGLKRYRKMVGGREVEVVAAWLEVPRSRGPDRGRQSRSRPAEAVALAHELESLLAEGPDLSFGVITFYKAQEEAILKELAARGIAEADEQGRLRIARPYRERPGHGGERLRVGTVDAFQGKEFDVVLLSLVRSSDLQIQDERGSEAYYRQVRRKYGFLCLENRLCVGMSRQQRLLVVVGDPAMAEGEVAAHEVPGLVAFRELTGGEHGLRL